MHTKSSWWQPKFKSNTCAGKSTADSQHQFLQSYACTKKLRSTAVSMKVWRIATNRLWMIFRFSCEKERQVHWFWKSKSCSKCLIDRRRQESRAFLITGSVSLLGQKKKFWKTLRQSFFETTGLACNEGLNRCVKAETNMFERSSPQT